MTKLSAATRKKLQRGIALLAVLGLIVAIVVVAILDRRVTAQFEGRRWTLPARVYAQPLELYAGQPLSVGALRAGTRAPRLHRADAGRPARAPTGARATRSTSTCARSRSRTRRQPAQRLEVSFDGESVTALAGDGGADVPVFRLDPLLIGSIFPIHGEDRIVVSPDQVPPLLPAALKAVEDRKFDTHHGVNPLAILRALFVNVRAGQVEQGGSTLTQQLVKSYFLDSRRTLRRKVEEAIMAFILESRFEKADIMNAYINEIYLGQDGRRAVHGFGLASQFYFGKPLSELNLQEVALMVAIVRGPSYYDPRRHAERALERRNLVLKVLAEQGVVQPADAERAAKTPLGITDNAGRSANYFPAFLDLVRRQLREDYPENELTEAGLTVFTTLDPLLQEKAEDRAERRTGAPGQVGSQGREGPRRRAGRHDAADRRNRRGRRRAARLVRRLQPRARHEAADRLAREAARLPRGARVGALHARLDRHGRAGRAEARRAATSGSPATTTSSVHGPVTLVRALTQSYNLATVNLGMDVGLGPVTEDVRAARARRRAAEIPVDPARRRAAEPGRRSRRSTTRSPTAASARRCAPSAPSSTPRASRSRRRNSR